uniref:Uncharacterized protein n=1 Tax=Anopheles coluzzii TaxID=1518534 RepID=A0A8W7PXI7_ANOCL
MHEDAALREGDALLRRLHHGAVVRSQDGGATDGHLPVATDHAVSGRQQEVVGDDGSTAQTGTGAEVAQQRHLVRELAGGRLLSIDDARRGAGMAQVLHLSRQTLPVVVELVDRLHLRPVDVDPFGTGERTDGQQAGNNKCSRKFHPDFVVTGCFRSAVSGGTRLIPLLRSECSFYTAANLSADMGIAIAEVR